MYRRLADPFSRPSPLTSPATSGQHGATKRNRTLKVTPAAPPDSHDARAVTEWWMSPAAGPSEVSVATAGWPLPSVDATRTVPAG